MFVGFSAVDVNGLAPAPKSQKKVEPTEVPVLVKLTTVPGHTESLEVKEDTGGLPIKMAWVALPAHVPSLTEKRTVFKPGVEYTMPEGFCKIEVSGVAPEPKFQK